MERKELNETLFTKAFETQRLASRVARETQNVAACCRNVRS
ncbi:hypothetical protein LEP1GSC021_0992 [Leptospira noguchii str. 1993005606]|uniref:Uncharacterized protein n=2 Tax=Leptospira noguchii TaxID=28182 RepID=M6YSU1_9LEPT|nr:hypothetical protein [Leptospira noguchii]EMN00392.1 hypothetical protein LEP1GSC035_1821 [Leptospira noguchii str. 2007001578]EPE85062.1 hypothetical protein LEP1GSC021_2778 [Leptospira noguchii str. 1993005606]EMN01564.1 hypothetical protein LEP1GSC035_4420 [Leptospira noguchii str. 2007001578]EMO87067.1 hypothetical protein LEP1GSC024_2440 [Leptospira noguchii str. 2001034031]EMO89423.1 hypothetical protein LEP1GSC024_1187 [Leptospira noguchii str. 2001034031]